MDEQVLNGYLEEIRPLRQLHEAGKTLSAINVSKLQAIQTAAVKMPEHPLRSQILGYIEGMLAPAIAKPAVQQNSVADVGTGAGNPGNASETDDGPGAKTLPGQAKATPGAIGTGTQGGSTATKFKKNRAPMTPGAAVQPSMGKRVGEADLSAAERDELPKAKFAYVDAQGDGHLPIHDKAHIKAARNLFGTFSGFPDADAKAKAARKIVKAARKAGVTITAASAVGRAAGLQEVIGANLNGGEIVAPANQPPIVAKGGSGQGADVINGGGAAYGGTQASYFDQGDGVNTSPAPNAVQEAAKDGSLMWTESVQVLEAVTGSSGSQWDVLLIEAGTSKNGNHYPADTLRKATPLFEGSYAFADHATDRERAEKPERSIKDKVGRFSGAQFGSFEVGGKVVEGIKARFKIIGNSWLKEALREAVEAGEPDFLGFSIDAEGKVRRDNVGGRMVQVVEAINRVYSVDVVTDPAAGGRIMRLVASNRQKGDPDMGMTKDEVDALLAEKLAPITERLSEAGDKGKDKVKEAKKLAEANAEELNQLKEAVRLQEAERRIDRALGEVQLSDLGKTDIRQRYMETAKRRDFDDEELKEAIQTKVAYEAAVVNMHNKPVSALRERIGMGDSEHDKYDKAMRGLFDNEDFDGVRRFRSIKEAYCHFTGADPFRTSGVEIYQALSTNYTSGRDHERVRESLSTASWANIFADHLYLKLVRDYSALPYSTMWKALVSEIEDVPDFITRHWDRVGGYADLASVAEQATYPTASSPTNEEATYTLSKYGVLDDVTFEMIVNDRVGSIRRIPTALARAASRTVYKFVLGLATSTGSGTGNIYDGTALYTSGHANNDTNTLTLANFAKAVQKMRAQTAYGEASEILGPRNLPKFVIVNNNLEQVAKRIVQPSPNYLITATADTDGSVDPQAFVGYNIQPFVYDQLTSTTAWYAIADPKQMETLVMGFLNGQQDPELFVQDQPNVGSAFTADKVTYKVRHIFAGAVLDFRSFYKGNA